MPMYEPRCNLDCRQANQTSRWLAPPDLSCCMRRLHYFQVPCHVSHVKSAAPVHSMLFCGAETAQTDAVDEAWPEAVPSRLAACWQLIHPATGADADVLCVRHGGAQHPRLATWRPTSFLALNRQHLGVPVAKAVHFRRFVDVTALEPAVAVTSLATTRYV
jgi:hypothetical protein